MNVYDFDKTIYDGDSTLDFYFFCLKKYPKIALCLPRQMKAAINYKLGKIDKTRFKEEFYCFFLKVKNMDDEVVAFWNQNDAKIKKWYRTYHKDTDLIISASPHFLLQEACNKIGVKNLIASQVNSRTGKYLGLNCYGEEKVRLYKERYNEPIDVFFSDSKSDQPLADISKMNYFVKGDKISVWKST